MNNNSDVAHFFRYLFNRMEAMRLVIKRETGHLAEASSAEELMFHLQSSQLLFESAAQLRVLETVVRYAWTRNGDVTMDELQKFVLSTVIRTGTGGRRSTSFTDNACSQLMSERWVQMAQDVGLVDT